MQNTPLDRLQSVSRIRQSPAPQLRSSRNLDNWCAFPALKKFALLCLGVAESLHHHHWTHHWLRQCRLARLRFGSAAFGSAVDVSPLSPPVAAPVAVLGGCRGFLWLVWDGRSSRVFRSHLSTGRSGTNRKKANPRQKSTGRKRTKIKAQSRRFTHYAPKKTTPSSLARQGAKNNFFASKKARQPPEKRRKIPLLIKPRFNAPLPPRTKAQNTPLESNFRREFHRPSR